MADKLINPHEKLTTPQGKLINEGLFDYLSEDAKEAVDWLSLNGLDRDLALSFIELNVSEEKVWSMPDHEKLDVPHEEAHRNNSCID